MQTVSGGAFGTTGAWLAWRQPRLAVGCLMLASGALQAVSFATVEYWVWAAARGPQAFGATTALWLAQWTWIIGLFSVALVLPPLLPDGRLVSDRWRSAFTLAVLATVAEGVRWALAPPSVWAATLPTSLPRDDLRCSPARPERARLRTSFLFSPCGPGAFPRDTESQPGPQANPHATDVASAINHSIGSRISLRDKPSRAERPRSTAKSRPARPARSRAAAHRLHHKARGAVAPRSQQASRSAAVSSPTMVIGSRNRFHFRPVVMVSTPRTAPAMSLLPWTYRA